MDPAAETLPPPAPPPPPRDPVFVKESGFGGDAAPPAAVTTDAARLHAIHGYLDCRRELCEQLAEVSPFYDTGKAKMAALSAEMKQIDACVFALLKKDA